MKLNFVLSYTSKDGKHYAIATQSDTNVNLLYEFDLLYRKDKCLGDVGIIHYAPSKKKAEELARFWNKCYKENGTLNIEYCGGIL